MKVDDINSFFTTADKNNDGYLTASELKDAIGSQETEVQKELNNLLDDSGELSSQTFNGISGKDKKLTAAELVAYFDLDEDSSVNEDEDEDEDAVGLTTLSNIDKDGKMNASEILKAYNNAAEGSAEKAVLSAFVTTNNKGELQVNLSKVRMLSGNKNLTMDDLLKADANGDKTVTESEIKNYLQKYEEFAALDINGDGKIKLSEIKKYAKALPDSALATYIAGLSSSKAIKNAFKVLSNGKNYVTADDIAKYDKDGNGIICTRELETFKSNCGTTSGTINWI